MTIDSPHPQVLVMSITGRDIGAFGPAPIQRLEEVLPPGGQAELFIDARKVSGVSVAVSSDWAIWLKQNVSRFSQIHMLAESQFVRITGEFVRRFSELQSIMRVHTNPDEFEAILAAAVDR